MWRDTVAGLKRGWFNGATRPLLVAYCRHLVLADDLAREMAKLAPSDPTFGVLSKMCEAELKLAIRLAGLLRITPRSTRATFRNHGNGFERAEPIIAATLADHSLGERPPSRPLCSENAESSSHRVGTQGGGTIRGSQQSALGWNFEI